MNLAALSPALLAAAAPIAAALMLWREFPGEAPWRALCVVVAAVLAALVVATLRDADFAQTAELVAVASLASAIAVVDVRRLLVPDLLVLALVVVAIASPGELTRMAQLAGAAVLGALFLFVRWFHAWRRGSEGLGLGDVKLAAASGLLLGPLLALQVTAGAAVLAIVWSALSAAPRSTPTPFGAALALGTVVAIALSPGRIT